MEIQSNKVVKSLSHTWDIFSLSVFSLLINMCKSSISIYILGFSLSLKYLQEIYGNTKMRKYIHFEMSKEEDQLLEPQEKNFMKEIDIFPRWPSI